MPRLASSFGTAPHLFRKAGQALAEGVLGERNGCVALLDGEPWGSETPYCDLSPSTKDGLSSAQPTTKSAPSGGRP